MNEGNLSHKQSFSLGTQALAILQRHAHTEESKLFYCFSLIFIRQIQLNEQCARRKNQLEFTRFHCTKSMGSCRWIVFIILVILHQFLSEYSQILRLSSKRLKIVLKCATGNQRRQMLNIPLKYWGWGPFNWKSLVFHLKWPRFIAKVKNPIITVHFWSVFILSPPYFVFHAFYHLQHAFSKQKWNNSMEMKNHREIRNEKWEWWCVSRGYYTFYIDQNVINAFAKHQRH